MAASGFEGFEKRLELRFSGDDPATGMGLRRIDFPSLEKILREVQCTVVSALSNNHFDSYVLSESSMFVYPTKIIIKTCGTTQLLRSVRPLARRAAALGLALTGCRYTRGSFIFPEAQPRPHTSFRDEVSCLEANLPENLTRRKVKVMKSESRYRWHVFTAADEGLTADPREDDLYTVEICMTGLGRAQAEKFFRSPHHGTTGDSAGMEMTAATGICDVIPEALVCDYAFDPCGYSMNGVGGARYSTVHVTPEAGFSYASFECVGSVYDCPEELSVILRKVVGIFRPAEMSVSTTGYGAWVGVAETVAAAGMRLKSRAADEFVVGGCVVFQTFAGRPK